MKQIISRIQEEKLFLLSIGFIGTLSCGAQYAVGLYSQDVKRKLNFSQEGLETLLFLNVMVTSIVSPFVGHVVDTYGPRLSCLVASFAFLIGYGGFDYVLSLPTHLAQKLCFLTFPFTGIGLPLLHFSILGCIAKKLQGEKSIGFYMSVLQGGYGLGASVITVLYDVIYNGKEPTKVLLLLAAFTVVISLICSIMLPWNTKQRIQGLQDLESYESLNVPFIQQSQQQQVYHDKQDSPNSQEHILSNKKHICQGSPITYVGNDSHRYSQNHEEIQHIDNEVDKQQNLVDNADVQIQKHQDSQLVENGGYYLHNNTLQRTILQILKKPAFYYGMGVFMTISCTGQLVINNTSLIAESFETPGRVTLSRRVQSGVISFSIVNFLSRIAHGYISDRVPLRRGIYLTIASCVQIIVIVIFLTSNTKQFFKGLFLQIGIAYAYGANFSLFPVYILDLYGKSKNSTVYGFFITCTFPFNVFLHSILGIIIDRIRAFQLEEMNITQVKLMSLNYTFIIILILTIFSFFSSLKFLKFTLRS